MKYFPSKIEPKWQKKWLSDKTYEPDLKRAKRPFYNLMMFPYPSAEGLHVGNMYAFTGADVYGRFKRMQGFDVFEPIGLDGFGIHSENFAIKIGKHPADQAKISEKNFYRQLAAIGNGFAWGEHLETYDPEYYKWTQWIFTQMFKRGLAYRKKAAVNWCPSCKTVLADEQVLTGECERCGTKVIKKDLEQWFFRITDYAERLLRNLNHIDWSEKIKIAQRNWIGKSEGSSVSFPVVIASPAGNGTKQSGGKQEIAERSLDKLGSARNDEYAIEVFTTRPDTLFGATYMVLAPEHGIISKIKYQISNIREVEEYTKKAKNKTDEERISDGREKTGVELKGVKAINPATKEEIPIWVADYVLGHVGTGAIMAVPAHDQRDWEFAGKFNLPVTIVVCPHYPDKTCPILTKAYEDAGHLVASGKFNGLPSEEAKWKITEFVGGKKKNQYRLRDWLISRQRYWGPPIPMIYCATCAEARRGERKEMPGWHPAPEKDLPVKLPYVKNFRPTGTDQSPLAAEEKFYKVRCPECGSRARRETDVSDTFLDSAWYYLGYLVLGNQKSKIKNQKFNFDKSLIKNWLPVDSYIGGAEHAVLHLLYVRFLAMAFYDWKMTHFEEPFKKFRAHGLVIKDGAKMSKSKGNIINPDEYIRAYGADALRMALMFLAPFEQGVDFRDAAMRGVTRFLERVWKAGEFIRAKPKTTRNGEKSDESINRITHKTLKKVTVDIDGLQYNTAISALMVLLNAFEEKPQAVSRENFMIFLQMLAPFAPHITEELWADLGGKGSIHKSFWPTADERFLKEDTRTIIIQINGRVRDRIQVEAQAGVEIVRGLALARPAVKKWMGKKPLKRFIYVPGRIANIVV